jgi:hypothetical protein
MRDPNLALNQIRIASPCTASWDEMRGDDTVRFCGHCNLDVYNLSSMTAPEAAAFLGARHGRTCVRLYKRRDGTVITRDCPVGVRARLRKMSRAAGLALTAVLGLFVNVGARAAWPGGQRADASSTLQGQPVERPDSHVLMGEVESPRVPAVTVAVGSTGGGPIAGAEVRLVDLRTGATIVAEDGGDGEYRFFGIAPGIYSLTASARGYEASRPKTVRVRSGKPVRLAVALDYETIEMGDVADPNPR